MSMRSSLLEGENTKYTGKDPPVDPISLALSKGPSKVGMKDIGAHDGIGG